MWKKQENYPQMTIQLKNNFDDNFKLSLCFTTDF